MKKIVSLKSIASPNEIVLLDTELGLFSVHPGSAQPAQGNYAQVEGQDLSLFAADKKLYFQWGGKRWEVSSLVNKIRYEHDFARQITVFSIDDSVISYPAWWVDDPTFDPAIPERDEEEDFFAYVASIVRDEKMQKILIESWDK